MTKIVVELYSEHSFHKKIIRMLLEHDNDESVGQQRLVDDKKVDAGDTGGVVLATDKQKAFMKRLRIDIPKDCTKDQASKLISDKQAED